MHLSADPQPSHIAISASSSLHSETVSTRSQSMNTNRSTDAPVDTSDGDNTMTGNAHGQNDNANTNQNGNNNNGKKQNGNFGEIWIEYAGRDFIILIIMALLGLGVPKWWLDEVEGWKSEYPGQIVNATWVDNVTNITFSTTVFLKDPEYSKSHTPDSDETVDTTLLFVLVVIPLIYVPFFLLILSSICNKSKKQIFSRNLILYEYVTFIYSFVIAMSITFWSVKSLKVLVAQPRPDFYDRCELDATDPYNLECTTSATDEIIKTFHSFPSGHSANMFTSGTVLVFYTWNKLNIKEPIKYYKFAHWWYYRPFIDFLFLWPVFLAAWAASTRLQDHLHTPTDILGGACVGYVAARIGYYSQYKYGSPFSYRALMFSEVQQLLRSNKTLQKLMYPKLFKHDVDRLLIKMTKEKNRPNNDNNTKNTVNKNNDTITIDDTNETNDTKIKEENENKRMNNKNNIVKKKQSNESNLKLTELAVMSSSPK